MPAFVKNFLIIFNYMLIRLLKSIYFNAVIYKSKILYKLRHSLKTFTLKGIRLFINDDSVLSKDVLLSLLQGGYEDKENKIIKDNLEPGDTVLELGAGLGFNSITIAKINGGKIVSYESNPYLISLIKRNQELNNVSFDVRNKILVSKKSGIRAMPFNIAVNVCMSSIKTYSVPGYVAAETRQIETEFIEDVLAELLPTFLVVDIEGGEEDFFSQPDLLTHSPVKKLMVEVHPEIIGDNACSLVVKNIISAGFNLATESSSGSVLYFSK